MMQGSAGASTSSNIPPSPAAAVAAATRPPSSSYTASAAGLSLSLQEVAEDSLFALLVEDLTLVEDSKLETQQALMGDLMESLRKEERLVDADAWKYAAPRSQLHLTSVSGFAIPKDITHK